jgi:multidrug transporter EmrE-like cation transporter
MRIAWVYLVLAILFNTVASSLFKISAIQKNRISIIVLLIGLIFGAINAVFYTKSLEKINLGIAYSIFSAGIVVLS